MISVYFTDTFISESNGFQSVHSTTSKKEIVLLVQDIVFMIDRIIRDKYHYDYCSPEVRAFSNASAMLLSLLAVYDVCPKSRLVARVFHIVGFVGTFFTDSTDFISFILNDKGEFTFNY